MVERSLGLISVDELVRVLPDLIADALRERDTRPPPASQATLTKATGVVTTAGTTTAEVQLDEDEPGVLSQVQLASAVSAGDRVVVLMSPGGSATAIGSGSAQTAVPLLNGPGDPNGVITAPEGWLYEQNDAPDLWQNTDGLSAWELVSGGGGGVPTDWVEYSVDSPPQGPYAYTVSARTVEWVDGSFSHGGAIVLNAGQPEVTEDGWYTLDTYVLVEAVTVGTTWQRALGILLVNRSFTSGGDSYDNVFLSQVFGPYVDNDGRAGGNASFSWTGYLMAGDSVTVKGLLAADVDPSDTWQIAEAQFRMEKLPM